MSSILELELVVPSFLQTEKRSLRTSTFQSPLSLSVHPRPPTHDPPTATARTLAVPLSPLLTAGYVSFANSFINIAFVEYRLAPSLKAERNLIYP